MYDGRKIVHDPGEEEKGKGQIFGGEVEEIYGDVRVGIFLREGVGEG